MFDERSRQPKIMFRSLPYRLPNEKFSHWYRLFSSLCVQAGPTRMPVSGRQMTRSAREAMSGVRGANALITAVVRIWAPTTAAHWSVKSGNGPAKRGRKLAGPVEDGRWARTASIRA